MRKTFLFLILPLLSLACGGTEHSAGEEDIDTEWNETGVEEDSILEDRQDILDEDSIDDESEVISEEYN